MTLRTRHLLAATLFVASTACLAADDPDIHWNAQGQASQHFVVAPGQLAEYCGKLAQGTRVDWHFHASGPLDFNIHFHEGKKVHLPEQQAQRTEAHGQFKAPLAQDFCWMWTNKAQVDVTLDVALQRL